MTVLVAGNAALLDLLANADREPNNSEVATLIDGPGSTGQWLPGGAALAIAAAIAGEGIDVRLWHPLPADRSVPLHWLRNRRVDISKCPLITGPIPRCIILDSPDGRLAWSVRGEDVVPTDLDSLLHDVTHVVFAPMWGRWANELAQAAVSRNLSISLVGEACRETQAYSWNIVVLDEAQASGASQLVASISAITRGAKGAALRQGEETQIIAAKAANVVNTTGAGDTFGGVFIARNLCGDGLAQAGHRAAKAAASACEAWGTFGAYTSGSHLSPSVDIQSRARGALIGTACGDAFGMPNSFLPNPPWRVKMEPGPANSPYHAGYPAGRITDDTEQAIALTDALQEGFDVSIVAAKLNDWFVSVGGSDSLAVGPSTMRALLAYQAGGDPKTIGRTGVTNGAAMRIAPIGVYAGLKDLSLDQTAQLVATACWPTHATTPAISGAMAIAWAIAAAIRGANWQEVVEASVAGAGKGAQHGNWVYAPNIAVRIEQALKLARDCASAQILTAMISDNVGAGEPTTETIPAAMAIADFANGNPALAIEIAGNLRGDTDTIAAIAGAICGAFAGDKAIPQEWCKLVAEVNQLNFERWLERLESVNPSHLMALQSA
jgi:ADP-ribosylglycohydrolase/sugar/nucleoside kinase (ribokinase family)